TSLGLSVFFFLLTLVAVTSDLESDRRALIALRDGVHGRPLLWNLTAPPCTWGGVQCNAGRVTALRLPGVGLSGPLPIAIGNLTKLETLSFRFNANLVTLIAYYFSRDEKLVVFEYMSRGSLSALLHGNKGSGRSPLSWETRAGIALGAARAISYLHSRDATTSHGNIKSCNILLSESYEAKVSDYCLAPMISPTSTPNRIDGYRAPEVTDARRISQKADVYSFGVLILELLTGKSPTHQQLNEEGVDLPRWVSSITEQQSPSDVFDPELTRYQAEGNENMIRLLKIGISCTAQYPDSRPSMAEVTRLIEEVSRSSGSQSPLSG
ncbi:hypothetical protein F2Q68_00007395, partial [Brassica cretica]